MARKGRIADPHAAREAERYDNPIPSREVILELLSDADKPLSHGHIGQALSLDEAPQQDALKKRLRAMERDVQIMARGVCAGGPHGPAALSGAGAPGWLWLCHTHERR